MTETAFAHGPWALLHSVDKMRFLINDVCQALDGTDPRSEGSQLYGSYSLRKAKTTHNRPLPLPDALLQGANAEHDAKEDLLPDIGWLKDVHRSPWLWKLQWTTLALLYVSSDLRKLLQQQCPKNVADKWLDPLEDRLGAKILGGSVETGLIDATAALTPVMTVVSEIMLLKLTYEH